MRRRWILPWLLAAAHADVVRPQSINHPELNSSASGQVALVGAFDSLSTVDYVGESSVLAPVSQNDNLISQVAGSWEYYLAATFADATVNGACLLDSGIAILSGNFSSIRGTSAQGIVRLDLQTGEVASLGNISLTGAVETLWCNSSVVYVGGNLQLGNSQGVGIWNDTAQAWSLPAFGGFPLGSQVYSIIPLTDDSVLFGGSLGAPLVGSSSESNPSQIVGLQAASVQATNNATSGGNILCTSGSAYEASSGSTTSVVAIDLGHTVYLSEINMVNPNGSSGTQQFRLVTSPSNSIMNLSYVDDNQQTQFCDAYCPLEQGSSKVFTFVNQVGTHNLTISMLSYYGDHAAIQGVQLFTNTSFVYANDALNSALNCQSVSSSAVSQLEGGDWQLYDDYESLNITTGTGLSDAYVRFYPNVSSGNYSLNLYTPGCLEYDTCSQRGQVNVTVYPGANLDPVNLQLFQTNNEVKYDPIYNGTLSASDGYPYVEVQPISGQQTPIEFVASYLEVAFVAATADVEINSLFEFSVSNYTTYAQNSSFAPVGNSALNVFGQQLDEVRALATFNGSVYVGGNFSDSSLYAFANGEATSVSTQGIVQKLYTLDSSLFAVQDYNSVYNVTSTYDQIYADPVNNLALFNLNGTGMLAFSVVGGETLDLFDLSTGAWYNGTSQVSGHLSETLVYNTSNFYFGSLRIQEAGASGAASVSDSLEVGTLPFELSNSSTSSTRRKRAASDVTGINCGVFYNSANILGGHFTASTSDGQTATNLISVNGSSSSPLGGINSDWTITAMAVSGSWLVMAGDVGSALAVYSLANQTLRDSSSVSGSVTSLLARGDTIVVSGNFSVDGCSDFCLYNVTSNKFSSLTNVQGGTVRGVQLWSGDEAVIYGEQLQVKGGSNYSLVQYGFNSGAYTPYTNTGIDGNITGLTVGQGATAKFLAVSWQNSSGGHNVQLYDGKTWSQNTSPLGGSVTSLGVLSTTQSNSTTLGNNILALNGALSLPGYGNASVASFDGQSWLPLFVASDGSGQGSINALYSEKQTVITNPSSTTSSSGSSPTSSAGRNLYMSKGKIVGISFAIAIGAISLLVIVGLIWGYFTQRRQFYQRTSRRREDADMAKHAPPETIMAY